MDSDEPRLDFVAQDGDISPSTARRRLPRHLQHLLDAVLGYMHNPHDHGRVRFSIEDQLGEAQVQLATLAEIGIHYEQVTRQLQEEGVQKFIDSFHKLFQCIDNKRKVL